MPHDIDESTIEPQKRQAADDAPYNTVIRAEMEREIKDENEIGRVMFDTAPIGMTICDADFNFIDCNQAALDMLGVTKQYYFDNFNNLSPEYQPDGSKSTDKSRENFNRALNGERLVAEWTYCSPSGEVIPTEITLTRAMYKDKYIALGYVYDLRNIKRMEARIESLLFEVDYDALTGIFNRRYFDKHLNLIIKLLSRSRGVLSLLMIDIDHFKNFNDTYGHIEGDKCLKSVASALTCSVMRDDDFVARYGGEEFVAVLPNTDENGARIIAEKMHENIKKCKILHSNKKNGTTGFVTVSIGGTTGCVNRSQSKDDYIRQADEMLYASKQGGRNRSTFSHLNK